MMGCGYLIGATLVAVVLVAVAAHFVARFFVARGGAQDTMVLLVTIVVTLGVLQLGSRLARIVVGLYERAGMDTALACGGNLGVGAFVGTILIIAAYVAAFFGTWKWLRG